MARRNKKVAKLRKYRDKLLVTITNLEGTIRHYEEAFWQIRKALQSENSLRAYALSTVAHEDEPDGIDREFRYKNEAVKELTLIYRMLTVERKYSEEIQIAVRHRDWLRTLALCEDHKQEIREHDMLLSRWQDLNGITRKLRKELEDEGII